MVVIVILAIWMLWVTLGVTMARKRNRAPWTWGLVCLMFGVFGVMTLALVGEKK